MAADALFEEFDPEYKITVSSVAGSGAYSTVHHVVFDPSTPFCGHTEVAVKQLTRQCSPARVMAELRVLCALQGQCNTIPLLRATRVGDRISLIMPYFPHIPFPELLATLTARRIHDYFRALLTALQHLHSFQFIHRDIKPINFLCGDGSYHNAGQYKLIDFGLAQPPPSASPTADSSRLVPKDKRPKTVAERAGTRGFRAPEVLLRCQTQTTALDIWSAGIILLSMLSDRYPFALPRHDDEALAHVYSLLGEEKFKEAATACKRTAEVRAKAPPRDLRQFCQTLRTHTLAVPDSVYSLLEGLLAPDPYRRLTASQALQHPFFAERESDCAFNY
eukprot:NODE_2995_length_1050_cov_25.614301_g2855_i0.p1 GENE.NODE_2995_length_1050_cov_25.614301_g2855_i0~~NODE_2995_length_1050_cov_25.614301_g2855_i0.p1  ORF type:complete len:346 (+),score=66.97 NODE_2995_length_1050_cov_25.614301_g2855_i0:37-1038(+)